MYILKHSKTAEVWTSYLVLIVTDNLRFKNNCLQKIKMNANSVWSFWQKLCIGQFDFWKLFFPNIYWIALAYTTNTLISCLSYTANSKGLFSLFVEWKITETEIDFLSCIINAFRNHTPIYYNSYINVLVSIIIQNYILYYNFRILLI